MAKTEAVQSDCQIAQFSNYTFRLERMPDKACRCR
jgi:hypothetical protein